MHYPMIELTHIVEEQLTCTVRAEADDDGPVANLRIEDRQLGLVLRLRSIEHCDQLLEAAETARQVFIETMVDVGFEEETPEPLPNHYQRLRADGTVMFVANERESHERRHAEVCGPMQVGRGKDRRGDDGSGLEAAGESDL